VVYMGKRLQGDSDRQQDIVRLHHQMLTAVHDGRSVNIRSLAVDISTAPSAVI
jgi:hypothetical protein